MRILTIEDDASTALSIELMLKSEGFHVYTTDLGEEGLELGKMYEYDLITLDLGLPDISGYDVLRRLRDARCKTPVLVLSGLAGVSDKVKALGLGADDYLTKPFHKDELVARIHAIVRRSMGHADPVARIGDMEVNFSARTVTVAGETVHLTGKEYQMIELLAMRQGSCISKEMFINHLYGGMDEPQMKIIDVFICKIRAKFPEGMIETVWGRGYMLRDPNRIESPSIAPELADMVMDPPTGHVSKRTFNDARRAAKIDSPSIVPVAGVK